MGPFQTLKELPSLLTFPFSPIKASMYVFSVEIVNFPHPPPSSRRVNPSSLLANSFFTDPSSPSLKVLFSSKRRLFFSVPPILFPFVVGERSWNVVEISSPFPFLLPVRGVPVSPIGYSMHYPFFVRISLLRSSPLRLTTHFFRGGFFLRAFLAQERLRLALFQA